MNDTTKMALSVLALAAAVSAQAAPNTNSRLLSRPSTSRTAGGNAAVAAKDASSEKANSEARASAAEGGDELTSDIYIPEGTDLDIAFKIYGQLVGKTVLKDPSTPDAKIKLVSLPGQKLTKEDQIAALEAAFEMNGIHMEPYGEGDDDSKKFVRALPRDKARGEAIPVVVDEDAVIPDSSKVYSVMIPFKNIPIDEAKTVMEGLKSPKGLLLVYERIGKILVTDTGLNINAMRKIAESIDVATPINENVYVRQIRHASAQDVKDAIQKIVEESQKELEKMSKAAAQGTGANSVIGGTSAASRPASSTLLRRPGQPAAATAAPTSVESLVASVSDADRGMIRGKVIITPDERSNKLIFITSKTNMDFFDKVIEELDVETTPDVEIKVYRLKYAEAEDVSDMINDLIGNTQKSSSRENQNAASKTGTSANLTRGVQQPQRNNASANQRGGDAKAGELTKDNTTVLADKRINGLVVMTQKELVPTVESIIESMDIKLSQVLIETVIIEVTLGDELKTGIDWLQRGRQHVWNKVQATDPAGRNLFYVVNEDGVIRGTAAEGVSVTPTAAFSGEAWSVSDMPVYKTVKSILPDGFLNNNSYMLGGGGTTTKSLGDLVAGTADPLGSGINYLLKSDKLNLAAIIEASKTDSRTKYLASPVVMTLDNKEATINATRMRYLLKGFTSSGNSYSTIAVPDYEQKELGIEIKVTPKINPNGIVMLTVEEKYSQLGVNQEIKYAKSNSANASSSVISDVTGTTSSSLESVMVPTTVTREMSADVLLENGQTVVFGGLTETTESESETGIPILKDIPWIGKWLFSSVEKNESRNELLVFMTPYVLDDAEAAQAEALRRKKTLSDTNPWEDHGWSASELADPVAKKEIMRRLKDEAKKQDEERQNRLAIEKWKLDRAKALEKMSDAERKFWIETHRDSLESKDEKKAFDKEMEGLSQEELKSLAEKFRAERVAKAQEKIDAAPEAAKELPKEAAGEEDARDAGDAAK